MESDLRVADDSKQASHLGHDDISDKFSQQQTASHRKLLHPVKYIKRGECKKSLQ